MTTSHRGPSRAKGVGSTAAIADYGRILGDVVEVIEVGRQQATRAVNTAMTATYWSIGRRVVEEELRGASRADYGVELVKRLAKDLSARFGRGFGRMNLYTMRQFYEAYPATEIVQMASGQSLILAISQRFMLPWSHYVSLLTVHEPAARTFYEQEALRAGWTVKQLQRQIGTRFYDRYRISADKDATLARAAITKPEDQVTVDEEVNSPYLFEFLGLRDDHAESDLEEALLQHLQSFLLELGGDFAFVARQRRLRLDDVWYKVDLVFFHRRLRCLVLIDLKLDELTHADVGQMNLYVNYAREQWALPEENLPVGIILCSKKKESMARYALGGLENKITVAQYMTALPSEAVLVAVVERAKRLLAARKDRP